MTLIVAVSKRLPLLETGLGDAGSISTAQRNVYSAIREQIRKPILSGRYALLARRSGQLQLMQAIRELLVCHSK